MQATRIHLVSYLCLLAACSKPAPEPAPEPAAEAQQLEEKKPEAAPKGPALAEPKDPNEACAQVIVVAYKGAKFAPDTVTRDKTAAKAEADRLLAEVIADSTTLPKLAHDHSDAPTSAARNGYAGTHTRDEWPKLHEALKEPLFALKVHETAAAPVEADYGYVVLHRCPVEKATGRHILIRYQGAKNAPEELKRTKDEAKALAEKLLADLAAGKDFAELAKKHSDDGSGERGGDIGTLGRGLLAPAFEESLFGLKVGERSGVVETDYGFHIIERLADK